MKVKMKTGDVVMFCIAVLVLVVIALSAWAKADPLPYCDADFCASSPDALRVMQLEGGKL